MNEEPLTPSDKVIVGLVGGIASGKSTVSRMIEDEGAVRVDADQLAHEALEQPDIQEKIRTEFGDEFVSDGSVNRSLLANVVFSDQQKTKKLNGLIHPYVLNRVEKQVEAFRNQDEHDLLVLDVPLLVETDLHELCDVIIFLNTPEELRLERVREHRGWSRDEFERREARQEDLSLKRRISDFIIDTSQQKDDVEKRVKSLLSRVTPSLS